VSGMAPSSMISVAKSTRGCRKTSWLLVVMPKAIRAILQFGPSPLAKLCATGAKPLSAGSRPRLQRCARGKIAASSTPLAVKRACGLPLHIFSACRRASLGPQHTHATVPASQYRPSWVPGRRRHGRRRRSHPGPRRGRTLLSTSSMGAPAVAQGSGRRSRPRRRRPRSGRTRWRGTPWRRSWTARARPQRR